MRLSPNGSLITPIEQDFILDKCKSVVSSKKNLRPKWPMLTTWKQAFIYKSWIAHCPYINCKPKSTNKDALENKYPRIIRKLLKSNKMKFTNNYTNIDKQKELMNYNLHYTLMTMWYYMVKPKNNESILIFFTKDEYTWVKMED
jgi:hypothetical protein